MRVRLTLLVYLMEWVILFANVGASITDSGILIDHNLILSSPGEVFKLDFASNSIARVLVQFDSTGISVTSNAMELADSIDRSFKLCDDIANVGRRIFFKRRVP